ncbi:MAG: substrate-binding domain-containing protein, partial [Terriglobus sp.]
SFLQGRTTPDAVMANSDALAAGARDAALAHGLAIPDAFQVVGCGNDPDLCGIGMPLTSVDLRGEELGTRAARLALKVIGGQGRDTSSNVRLNPVLMLRSTTRGADAHALRGKGKVSQ